MTTATIKLPPKLIDVFSGEARYRGAYGGRGSGKTANFAKMTAVRGMMFAQAGISGQIVCSREYMNSLDDSSMLEVKQAIRSEPWLSAYYEIGEKFIRSRNKRINYNFVGLRNNLDSIKSKAAILINWADEAENISELAWQKLIPTVRHPQSEIWVTWNPERDGSPTDFRFRKNQPDNSKIIELNYTDNPWFPDVLDRERVSDRKRLDDATYRWIWDGAYRENSDAQVFGEKYEVKDFEVGKDWDGPYIGLDFGFSQDPTAMIRCWIAGDYLYIDHEATRVKLDIDQTPDFLKRHVPDCQKYVVRADSARPESISYLKRNGFPKIKACEKGKGSVEDGIAHIRSYQKVYIHPRCKNTLEEFRKYSYKVDRLSGDVLPDLVSGYDHLIDALRYALEPVMKRKSKGWFNA